MKSNQVHVFTIEDVLVRAIITDNYVEYNFYAKNGDWRRYFISTVGFNGSNEELEQVGKDVFEKRVLSAS